jgi:hypothetical protein
MNFEDFGRRARAACTASLRATQAAAYAQGCFLLDLFWSNIDISIRNKSSLVGTKDFRIYNRRLSFSCFWDKNLIKYVKISPNPDFPKCPISNMPQVRHSREVPAFAGMTKKRMQASQVGSSQIFRPYKAASATHRSVST